MAEGLASLGHEAHFLYLQQPLRVDETGMRQYWQDRLHVFRSLSPSSFVGRARRKLTRVVGKTFHLNLPVDCYFDPEAARHLRAMVDTEGFDTLIVSYVFYSKLLESLPDFVRKLIDTHDVFSNRFRLYREHGQANEFFSTAPGEEGRALDRADAVLAIQQWDAAHFRLLTGRPVSVVGHLAAVAVGREANEVGGAPAILFVGGPMGINVHGLTWFVDAVLPAVRRHVPSVELWLVGSIARRFRRKVPGLRRFGFVADLGGVYRRATVVINPQQFGTGLSIKSVDAMLHGRPLVTTASGGRGLEEGVGVAFRQAGSAEEFGEHLVELLRDRDTALALARGATAFAHAYHSRNLRALADVLDPPAVG
jgi:hypothetical protein